MDFGLGESLKMFEDHFGKRWSRLLLLLIGLAVAAFCIHAIYQYLLLPIYHIVTYVMDDNSLYDFIKHKIISTAISALIFVLFVILLNRIAIYFLFRRFDKRINATIKDLKEGQAEASAQATELLRLVKIFEEKVDQEIESKKKS